MRSLREWFRRWRSRGSEQPIPDGRLDDLDARLRRVERLLSEHGIHGPGLTGGRR